MTTHRNRLHSGAFLFDQKITTPVVYLMKKSIIKATWLLQITLNSLALACFPGCKQEQSPRVNSCDSPPAIDTDHCIRKFAEQYLTELLNTFHERIAGPDELRESTRISSAREERLERWSKFRKKYHTSRMQLIPNTRFTCLIVEKFTLTDIDRPSRKLVRVKVKLRFRRAVEKMRINRLDKLTLRNTSITLKKLNGAWKVDQRPDIFLASPQSARTYIQIHSEH